MTELKIKKSTVYFLGILLILAGALIFMMSNGGSEETKYETNTNSGESQRIVLGMKSFNYFPNTITIKAGTPISLSLDKSVTGCFRDFTIKELGIHEYLKTPEDTIDFTPTKPGTYTFACSMGMGTGTLVVE